MLGVSDTEGAASCMRSGVLSELFLCVRWLSPAAHQMPGSS